jgi:hypothetical protein
MPFLEPHSPKETTVTMAMDPCQTNYRFKVPWDQLRAWIDTAEAAEKQNGSNAHISRAQMTALSLLVPFTHEEELERVDYVGALMSKSTLVYY